MAAEKIKVNVYMSPIVLKALKLLARQQDRPYAELIREACREYVKPRLKAVREQRT